MGNFLQLHVLTTYPPGNPNRDDLGHPKSARFGMTDRLRISSQSKKRAARLSDIMTSRLEENYGVRTRQFGRKVEAHLLQLDVDETRAEEVAMAVAAVFGKLKEDKGNPDARKTDIDQVCFISPAEQAKAFQVAENMAEDPKLYWGKDKETGKEGYFIPKGAILRKTEIPVDVAMFGRMLAGASDYNVDAAVQFSHAITTHRSVAEDDFFTAVDDLQNDADGKGTAHLNTALFGAGVFYLYVCIDIDLLVANLGGDRDLAAISVRLLTEAIATTTPSGKQNSFATRPFAGYIRAEQGVLQPRTLENAFLRPVEDPDVMTASIDILEKTAARYDRAYGQTWNTAIMNVESGEGSLSALCSFVDEVVKNG